MPTTKLAVAVILYNCTGNPLPIRQDLISPAEGLKLFFYEDLLSSAARVSDEVHQLSPWGRWRVQGCFLISTGLESSMIKWMTEGT